MIMSTRVRTKASIKEVLSREYEDVKPDLDDATQELKDIYDAIYVPYMKVGMISGIPESSVKKMWKLAGKDGALIKTLFKHLDVTIATLERQLLQLGGDVADSGGDTAPVTSDAVFAVWNRQRMGLESELKPLKGKFKTVSRSYQQYINLANRFLNAYPDNRTITGAAEDIISLMEETLANVPAIIDDYTRAYEDMGGEVNGVTWKVGDRKFNPK